MEQSKALEMALHTCQTLESSLHESMRIVQRLKIQYNCESEDQVGPQSSNSIRSSVSTPPSMLRRKASTSQKSQKNGDLVLIPHSLPGALDVHLQLNCKFLKVKRSMEALVMQLKHVTAIANRQKNYLHLNQKGRVCCH